MNNLEINKVVKLLGDYKKCGNEYLFQCPYCIDKSRNNFSYNVKKNFLWCFASNGEHSKRWLKEVYNKTNNIENVQNNYKYPQKQMNNYISDEKLSKNFRYAMYCNNTLLNSPSFLELLFKKRKINQRTAKDCLIGFDFKRNNFVFPSIEYTHNSEIEIKNFEFRKIDLTKNGLYKQRGGINSLTQINKYSKSTENLIILGGYIDCYSFYQYLCEQDKENLYHITTSSNGEPLTLKYLEEKEQNLSKYKKHYLCLDNDATGIETMQKIIKKYPFFETIKLLKGYKDFNEFYTDLQ